MRVAAAFIILSGLSGPAGAGGLPLPDLTPGAVRTTDVQDICTTKTRTVRNVTTAMKDRVRRSYGLKSRRDGVCGGRGGCEIDHLIPLTIGGSNDQKNLWPQPFDGEWNAHHKDKLEWQLHVLICGGKVTPEEAQAAIAADWIAAYRKWMK